MGLPDLEKWWDRGELGILDAIALSTDDPPSGAVRFPDLIRAQLKQSFRKEWAKVYGTRSLEGSDECFIENLEWFAERNGKVNWGADNGGLDSQATREKLEAVANALDGLATALDKAPGMECWMIAMGELARRGYSVPLVLAIMPPPWAVRWPLQEQAMPSVADVAAAFRSGLKNRVGLRRKGKRYFEPYLAERIVRTLEPLGIKASTSSTGLAGLAFESTCELAGKGSIRASHWIRDAHKSWKLRLKDQDAAILVAAKTHAVQRDFLAMLKRHT